MSIARWNLKEGVGKVLGDPLLPDWRYTHGMRSDRLILILAFWCVTPIAVQAQASSEADAARYATAGQQALASGQYAEAQTDFEKLATLEPGIAEVHATLAAICFKQREYEEAVSEVKMAQRLKPSLPRLDRLLGLSLSELGQFSEALPRLEKGFNQSADPDSRRMCGLQLLRAYAGLDRDADAVETALALNKFYPDDPEVLYHTGRVYGNFAYIVMEKLHDKAPGSIWMLQAQGEANESQKNYDAAIIAFNHVLALDARRPGIHYRLGRIYLGRFDDARNLEDRQAAKREFLSELEVDPGNGNASYELAQMSAEDNDLDGARKQFEALVARFPDFEQALVGLGGIYLQTQLGAQAAAILERATKLNTQDEVAWYRLAMAERAAGNRDGAEKALATYRSLHASTVAARNLPASDAVTPQQLGPDEKP
jgi:predicted Zn-dependent protease